MRNNILILKVVVIFCAVIVFLINIDTHFKTHSAQNNGQCKYSCYEGEVISYTIKHKECKCVTNDEVTQHYNLWEQQ